MNERNRLITANIDPEPARQSVALIVAVGALVAGVVLSIAVWWGADPVNDQNALHREPHANSGVFPVPPQPAVPAPVRADAPDANGGPPSVAQNASADSGGATPRPAPPHVDLAVAIKRAQAQRGNPTISPPPGQPSWQGMAPKDAAKVFEGAVKAASYASPESPFHNEKPKD